MKLELYVSKESSSTGYFEIWSELAKEKQEYFKTLVLEILMQKLNLPTVKSENQTLETIVCFSYTNGANLHVVDDQFLGITIESKDQQAINDIEKMLREILEK